MKKFNQILLAVGMLTIAGSVTATQIQGSIGFTGSYQIKNGSDEVVTNFYDGYKIDIVNAYVSGTVDGDFAAEGIVSGQSATYADITYDPFGPISELWKVGSFTFDLANTNDPVVYEYISGSMLILSGSGWINSTTPGLDQTFGVWNFSANSAGTNFTWSSSAAAPEPGVALLLGIGLIGFGVVRKLRKAA